jgi:hypothetical protein
MSNGFVLVLLREIRESILKLRQELTERLDQTNERADQIAASLGRVENEINELRKFMRQIALNQSKHEESYVQHVAVLENEMRDLRDQLRRLRQGI